MAITISTEMSAMTSHSSLWLCRLRHTSVMTSRLSWTRPSFSSSDSKRSSISKFRVSAVDSSEARASSHASSG